jgi:histidine triad (HIT) family protein
VEDCLFCKIVRGEVPGDVVLDEPDVLAFRDINPQAPVHVLVIPKIHLRDVTELAGAGGGLLQSLLSAAVRIAGQEGVAEAGWRLVTNVGEEGGQRVWHLHLHVLGGRPMGWPPG